MGNKPTHLSIEELERLEYLSPEDGEGFLAAFDLPEELLAAARRRLGRKLPRSEVLRPSYDPTTRNFRAAAYLLGASFHQIALLHDVASQTVMSSISRILPAATRQSQRLATKLSLEALADYQVAYEHNREYLNRLTPRQAAEWLLTNTQLDNE